jgi:lysophospholipase L1-like esterase
MRFRAALTATVATLVLAGISFATAPAAPPASAAAKPTIFVCGDSTAKNSGRGANGNPMQGWGTPIAQFFDPAKVTVNNVGHAGTSSLTYYTGDWPDVLAQIKAGDFVVIVFGINDGGRGTPNGTGDEVANGPAGPQTHTYGWYMGKMATDAREKGGRPFFLTVTTRNMWTNPKVTFRDATPAGTLPAEYDPKQDKIERGTGNGRYTQWTKDVGQKLHVPVFDLTNYCADLYEKMGREEVNKLYSDHNHTYVAGAELVAKSIVAGLKGFRDSPFVPLLSEPGKAVPAAEVKYIRDNLSESASRPQP